MENLNTNIAKETAVALDAEARKALEEKFIANKKAMENLKKENETITQQLIDSGVGADGDTQYDGVVLKVVSKTKTEKCINSELLVEECIGDISLLKDLKKYVGFTKPATLIKFLETDYQDVLEKQPKITTFKSTTKIEVVEKKPKEIEVKRENLNDLF